MTDKYVILWLGSFWSFKEEPIIMVSAGWMVGGVAAGCIRRVHRKCLEEQCFLFIYSNPIITRASCFFPKIMQRIAINWRYRV